MLALTVLVVDVVKLNGLFVLVSMECDCDPAIAQKRAQLLKVGYICERFYLLAQARCSEVMMQNRNPERYPPNWPRRCFDQAAHDLQLLA
ncbi:hypothetical protein MesoLjLc_67480 [Mesorhizobium sp. L-8-10]|nr:hypothetical protein MesoLjLc_67480 [Mesorhizobium sp. L-8-10]